MKTPRSIVHIDKFELSMFGGIFEFRICLLFCAFPTFGVSAAAAVAAAAAKDYNIVISSIRLKSKVP